MIIEYENNPIYYTFSINIAMPWPPPMHRLAIAYFLLVFTNSCVKFTSILPPLMPIGCAVYGNEQSRLVGHFDGEKALGCSSKTCDFVNSKFTQCDCTTVDVGFVQIQTKILLNGQKLRGERFVDLDDVDLI